MTLNPVVLNARNLAMPCLQETGVCAMLRKAMNSVWSRRVSHVSNVLTCTAFIVSGLVGMPLVAQAEDSIPDQVGHVVDRTGTLTRDQIWTLDHKIEVVEKTGHGPIAVLIVPSTQPEGLPHFSERVVDQWGLGDSEGGTGVLLVVDNDDHTARIQVGSALKEVFNDALKGHIINGLVLPQIRDGHTYSGVEAGVDNIVAVASAASSPTLPKRSALSGFRRSGPVILILAFVLSSILWIFLGRLTGSIAGTIVMGSLAWWFTESLWVGAVCALITLVMVMAGAYGGSRLPVVRVGAARWTEVIRRLGLSRFR